MARCLSVDLRERVAAAVDGGMSRRQAAERFGVSAASAVRWMQQKQRTGTVRPGPQGGDKRSHRCCQSNGNLSPFGRTLPYPGVWLGVQGPPLGQGG